jgi:hypothetical protein
MQWTTKPSGQTSATPNAARRLIVFFTGAILPRSIMRMTLHQDGDGEGILVFDPVDPGQAKLAIKCVKAKAKRQMSHERLAALSETLVKARKACQEGVF